MAKKTEYIAGKTPSGFEFKISEEVLDDWDMFEDLAKIDSGDIAAIFRVAHELFDDDQMDRLKDHCRSETGKVSAKKVIEEIREVFTAAGEDKTKNF